MSQSPVNSDPSSLVRVPQSGLIDDELTRPLQVVVMVERLPVILPTEKVVVCVGTKSLLVVDREWAVGS